jgi:RNA recognition motif-containing protein
MPAAVKLFLKNVPWDATEADVVQFLAEANHEIDIISVEFPPKADPPRGYCFVEVDSNSVDAALKCDGLMMDGRVIHVEIRKPRDH